jgi:hypothetical protein
MVVSVYSLSLLTRGNYGHLISQVSFLKRGNYDYVIRQFLSLREEAMIVSLAQSSSLKGGNTVIS